MFLADGQISDGTTIYKISSAYFRIYGNFILFLGHVVLYAFINGKMQALLIRIFTIFSVHIKLHKNYYVS